jgi:vacuolar-type H+-ATPase subunit H
MNEQITNMNDLAESLVEQAPMSVTSEIEVAKEDAIAELQTAIKNTKSKAIAQWDITTATQDMLHGLESKINNTMDKIIDKRKTEFQTIQQDMENLIERRRTEFESHVEVFIENEIGKHEDSTLHHTLTIALAEAAEQMPNIKENAKKAVDDYIAMRKQELEDEIGEINRNTSYDNKRNMPIDNNRQEHDYTPSHTDQQDTTHEAPAWQRQVILNRNSLQVTSNIPRFRRETIQHNLTNDHGRTNWRASTTPSSLLWTPMRCLFYDDRNSNPVELPFQWNQQYTMKHYKRSPAFSSESFWKRYPKNALHFENFWIHMPPSRMDTQLYTRSCVPNVDTFKTYFLPGDLTGNRTPSPTSI